MPWVSDSSWHQELPWAAWVLWVQSGGVTLPAFSEQIHFF